MATNRCTPPGTIVPSLIYNDVEAAMAWLCDAFGFSERLRACDEDGKISHAQLSIGNGGLLLGAARVGHGSSATQIVEFRPPRPNEVSVVLMVQVSDVDRHYERAKKAGARILAAPTTFPFGERQYIVEDLNGHRWTFSQSVADVRPEDWGAQVP